jgi:hypothetical protein
MEGFGVLENHAILSEALETRLVQLNRCLFTNLSTDCMSSKTAHMTEVNKCTRESLAQASKAAHLFLTSVDIVDLRTAQYHYKQVLLV